MAGHCQETALTDRALHCRRHQAGNLQGTAQSWSSPPWWICLRERVGGLFILSGGAFSFWLLGKKELHCVCLLKSPVCSLRHEDRTHPYKSWWRKSETRKKWLGIAAETVCVHSASKGNDTDTVSKEGHRVDHKSQTFSICFIRLCRLFLQEVQQLSENFEVLLYLCGLSAVHGWWFRVWCSQTQQGWPEPPHEGPALRRVAAACGCSMLGWGAQEHGADTSQHQCPGVSIPMAWAQPEQEESLLEGSRPLPWAHSHSQTSNFRHSQGNRLVVWGGGALPMSAAGLVLLFWLFQLALGPQGFAEYLRQVHEASLGDLAQRRQFSLTDHN